MATAIRPTEITPKQPKIRVVRTRIERDDPNADLTELRSRFPKLPSFEEEALYSRIVAIGAVLDAPNPDFYGIHGVVAPDCHCQRCEALRRSLWAFHCTVCGFYGEPHIMPCTCESGKPCNFTLRPKQVRFAGCPEHGNWGCPTCGTSGDGQPLVKGTEGVWQMVKDIRTIIRPR
jgi:hypothetical protein